MYAGSNNEIYLNNFQNNTHHVFDWNINRYNSSTELGNYWDDYTGLDADGDGIGDTPYPISGGSNQDYYPLMQSFKQSDIVYVDDDYTYSTPQWHYDHFDDIQDGIDAVSENGTVYVFNGTYYENVIINKTIHLIGENRNNTIIDGNNYGDVIYVTSDFVCINGFSIRHSGNTSIPTYDGGIDLCANYSIIENNFIYNNLDGIYLRNDVHHDSIISNIFDTNYRCGINSQQSHCNIFDGNEIYNHFKGIFMSFSSNNTISNNTINSSSDIGIDIRWNSYNNKVIGNTVSFTMELKGLSISEGNVVFHNNLHDNIYNADGRGNDVWDDGYPSGGNYWDDYDGVDLYYGPNQDIPGSDGIGDTPYTNFLFGDAVDYYPLMQPWNGTPLTVPQPLIVYIDDDFNSTTIGWQYDHFDVIQDGIDAVAENGTVYVYDGTYYENVIVNKTINLIGENRESTIIDGGDVGNVVHISADWVNISGFSMRNSGVPGYNAGIDIRSNFNTIADNNVSNNYQGILLYYTSNNIVTGNNVDSSNYFGIYLRHANNNTISRNNASNNHYGIYLYYSSNNSVIDNNGLNNYMGIRLEQSGNNIITGNNANSNTNRESNTGFYFWYSSNNTITGNNASNIKYGIDIEYSSNNTVIGNIATSNTEDGIVLADSNNNIITNNNVSYNRRGIPIYGSSNNKITGNNASNCVLGVHLSESDTNTVIENNALYNLYGIWIAFESYNNTILDNYASNNTYGIYLEYLSTNNIISGNKVTNNSEFGIFLDSSTNNIIFNNYFHNINNFFNNCNNIWNISKTPGTNIIGGLYLGGNYWSDYYGVDSDGDGLGDTEIPYGPGDYLPLTNLHPLDLIQSVFNHGFPIRHTLDGDWGSAQSFIPTLDTFTSADIYMRKFGTPEFDLIVELRENHPQGTLIDTLTFTPADVGESWCWLSLDFDDTLITPGIQYFIVCPPAPPGGTTSFGYEWGYAFGDVYPDGAFWFTRNGGVLWRDLPTMYEFCFRTYGYS